MSSWVVEWIDADARQPFVTPERDQRVGNPLSGTRRDRDRQVGNLATNEQADERRGRVVEVVGVVADDEQRAPLSGQRLEGGDERSEQPVA